jgi:hypothetical protein
MNQNSAHIITLMNVHVAWISGMGVVGLIMHMITLERTLVWWGGILISSLIIGGGVLYWLAGKPGLWVLLAVLALSGSLGVLHSSWKGENLLTANNILLLIGFGLLIEVLVYGIVCWPNSCKEDGML